MKKQNSKVTQLQLQRDLFGQLLRISLEKTLDIDKILAYPLTPVPLALSHLDGSICKTEKALMQMFEKRSPSEPPERTDVIIHDGFFCSTK